MTGDLQVRSESGDLQELRAELVAIKKKVPTLPRWLTTAGAVCGLIAALLSVGGACWSVYRYVSRAPKLSAIGGSILQFSFMPKHHRIAFGWTLSVANDGDISNIVTGLTGIVSDKEDVSRQVVVFAPTDFRCVSGQASISIPFAVGQGLPSSMMCEAGGYLPETGKRVLLDGLSKRLLVRMVGERRTSGTLSYCFDLPDESAEDIRAGTNNVSLRFVEAKCQ